MPDWSAALDTLQAEFSRAGPSTWLVRRLDVEADFDHLLQHFSSPDWDTALVYDEVGQVRFFGLGCAARIRREEPDAARFAGSWQDILELQAQLEASDELLAEVRWFGGGAFQPAGSNPDPAWTSFGNTTWVLPQVLMTENSGRCSILVIARGSQLPELLPRLRRLADEAPQDAPSVRVLGRETSTSVSDWERLVEGALSELRAGRLEKVVTARRETFRLSSAPDLVAVLRRLRDQATRCTVFALRLEGQTFLGASPELLVSRTGRSVHTEALAGTLASSEPHAEQRLLESDKDRREHAFVVDEIRRVLEPLCRQVDAPTQPEVLALRRMLHLRTPIRGDLLNGTTVLELVGRLHPTPAVGGLPTRTALSFLASEERLDRGWYASPFGWVDAQGDGRFIVALRSALIEHATCHLYAGAGIVESSLPQLELRETELKLGAMLGALGLAD